jgi:ribosomal protein S18 acetylase RimI-like enzyme
MALLDQIKHLEPAQYPRARVAISRAFLDYNLMLYAAPNARRRAPGVTSVYAAFLSDAFRYGEVFAPPEVVGVCCWLPPGRTTFSFLRQVRAGMLTVPWWFGLRGFRILTAYDEVAHTLHHRHASMPHHYLSAIGVEPEHQGKGIGGALMRPMLERADSERLPCYLETHSETNVRLYQKHGFEISERADVPGHPLPVWGMLRRPR